MLHILRRNVNVTVLLFNNRIYGLTKGQYSPTSELGKVTKSTPLGSTDRPVNPLAFALGCGATFVARTVDRDIPHMDEMLKRAAASGHRVPGDPPELQRVQRPRVERASTTRSPRSCTSCGSSTASRCCSARPTPQGRHHEGRDAHGGGRQERARRARCGSTTRRASTPPSCWPTSSPGLPGTHRRVRSIEAPIYEDVLLDQEKRALSERGPGDIAKLLTSGDTWKIE
jgi:2-oxoglutarate ferredoxin oxidoreductase subunit beta